MSDGNRKQPVNYVVMHHSVGPEFNNNSDLEVQDWFDKVGASRGYAGKKHSYHYHPQRDKETFAQAHLALREFTSDGNKYGWRLTELMKDIWGNVAWHASNWDINCHSIGIETCGDYSNKILPEKACMLIADFFRPQDKALGGKLQIRGHRQFKATICPGRIMENLGTIIDMINNPDKWNAKLFPAPVPIPTPTPTPEIIKVEWRKDNYYRIFDQNGKQLGAFANNPMNK